MKTITEGQRNTDKRTVRKAWALMNDVGTVVLVDALDDLLELFPVRPRGPEVDAVFTAIDEFLEPRLSTKPRRRPSARPACLPGRKAA